MKLRLATNPSVVEDLRPHIIPDEDMSVDDYLKLIAHHLLYSPRNLRVWVVYDDSTTEVYAYFIVVWQPPAQYTFISQAKVLRPELSEKIVPQVWAKIQGWTESLGFTKIRAETARGEAIIRKYKFREVSRTVEYALPSLESTEETINGQDEVNTEVGEHSEQRSEVDSGRLPVPVLPAGSGTASDPVHGNTGTGADPGVSERDGADQPVVAGDGVGEPAVSSSGESVAG